MQINKGVKILLNSLILQAELEGSKFLKMQFTQAT